MIVLSQVYEDGWIAYEDKGTLPLLFESRLEHEKVNGWANGFIVDSECESGCNIVIVYWPQYLQYVGIGILIAALTYFTYKLVIA